MRAKAADVRAPAAGPWPLVTIVFLVHNRREELRTSLRAMLDDYEPLEAIVVDNASTDGSAEMVRAEFPRVRLIARRDNIGVPAWNDGFAVARGDYVLALDDDCYLERGGLARAVAAARANAADLVSFKVVSTVDPVFVFTEQYRLGLLGFWGCGWLVRRPVLADLGGFDPAIAMWGNELEIMLRFFDRGYRHLHLPDVVAEHMSRPTAATRKPRFRANMSHWAYIAAKRLRAPDAAVALGALLATSVRDGVRDGPWALAGMLDAARGFARGLRRRDPVTNSEVSHVFRTGLECYANPLRLSRRPRELIRDLPREIARGEVGARRPARWSGRLDEFYAARADLYPAGAATLEF